jgi:hypothetical protein
VKLNLNFELCAAFANTTFNGRREETMTKAQKENFVEKSRLYCQNDILLLSPLFLANELIRAVLDSVSLRARQSKLMTTTSTTTTPKRPLPCKASNSSSGNSNSTGKRHQWKEKLRQACLVRARKQRRFSHSNINHDVDNNQSSDVLMSTAAAAAATPRTMVTSPRSMVEDEIRRRQGVLVMVTPSTIGGHHEPLGSSSRDPYYLNHGNNNDDESMEEENDDNNQNDDEQQYFLTEDELLELLEEVQAEIDNREEQEGWLEQELELSRQEEAAMQGQIEEYIQWSQQQQYDEMNNNNDKTSSSPASYYDEAAVLCPICQDAQLMQMQTCSTERQYETSDLICPNHMDGSCAFRLSGRPGLSLSSLRQRLARVYSTAGVHSGGSATYFSYHHHREDCSNSDLSFQIVPSTMFSSMMHTMSSVESSPDHLVAFCHHCQRQEIVTASFF